MSFPWPQYHNRLFFWKNFLKVLYYAWAQFFKRGVVIILNSFFPLIARVVWVKRSLRKKLSTGNEEYHAKKSLCCYKNFPGTTVLMVGFVEIIWCAILLFSSQYFRLRTHGKVYLLFQSLISHTTLPCLLHLALILRLMLRLQYFNNSSNVVENFPHWNFLLLLPS